MDTGRAGLQMVGCLAALLVLGLWAGTALAATINVPADYASIQAAIDAANDGDEVVIATGTYYECIDCKGKAITVRSTNPDDPVVVAATVIDGQKKGSVVTFADGEGRDSAITGVTMTNGNGTLVGSVRRGGGIYCLRASPTIHGNTVRDNVVQYGAGGGIYCEGGRPTIAGNEIRSNSVEWLYGGGVYCSESSARIEANTITGNSAYHQGGGIDCRGGTPKIDANAILDNRAGNGGGIACEGGRPTISRNQIRGNFADWSGGGGIWCERASAAITGNTISNNTAYEATGGGVYCYKCSAAVESNTISANSAGYGGGGIYCYRAWPTIQENRISGNRSRRGDGGGIECFYYCSPTIRGNEIRSNSAWGHGGGVDCYVSSPTIDGNTISGNSAGHWGGGIYCSDGSAPAITNTIVAFCLSGGGMWAAGRVQPTVSYCDVYGNAGGDYLGFTPSGPGNISKDPLFADAAGGNLHLKSTGGRWDPVSESWVCDAEHSPCINRGDPAADWSNEPLPNGGRVNMGAYGNTPEASKSRRLHLPRLSWLGTAGYEADGVDPDQGAGGHMRFRFKVLYSDADGHAPRYVSLHLRRNGKPLWEFTMVRGVGDYAEGRVYRRTRKLPPGNYEHCFKARDRDGLATGEATEWTPGPIVGPRTAVALTSLAAVPTNTGAQITFGLSSAAQVQARILNIAGRPVKTLCHARDCEAGSNTLLWNATSDSGLAVPNGRYLVEVAAKAPDGSEARALGRVRLSR